MYLTMIIEMFYIVSNMVAASYIQPLNTSNVASTTEELYFFYLM